MIVGQWHGMAQNGSLEEMEQINLRIHLTELTGLGPLLEMGCLQMVIAIQLHGMEHDGWLEVMEQIDLHIRPMELTGLRPLLEVILLQASVQRSHHKLYYLI